MRQGGSRPDADNRRKRAPLAAHEANLVLQVVRDFALRLLGTQRGADHRKSPLRQVDRRPDFGNLILALYLPELLHQAGSLHQLNRLERLRHLVELRDRDRVGLDRQLLRLRPADHALEQLQHLHRGPPNLQINSGAFALEVLFVPGVAEDDRALGQEQQVAGVAGEAGQVRDVDLGRDQHGVGAGLADQGAELVAALSVTVHRFAGNKVGET
jgi:hypothetical protein